MQGGHNVRVLTSDVGSVEGYYRFGVRPVKRPGREIISGVEVTRVSFGGSFLLGAGRMFSLWPGPLGRRLAWETMRVVGRRFHAALAHEIEVTRPDVVVALPHLVANVQAVLEIREHRWFPLVMEPLLHEQDSGWDGSAMATALAKADAVLAITPHEMGRLVDAYGIPRERVFLGGMGVDMTTIRQDRRPGGYVLFLGRKTRTKGIHLLLKAMQDVWSELPEVTLVLAGARTPDTDEIDANLASLEPRFRGNVSSLDDISDQRKVELLGSAACLVLPSKVESFGGVILEAWASGVPVVTLDLPVFRSIVTPGQDGLLAVPDDPECLAKAMLTLLKNPDAAKAMGERGRENVQLNYTWDQVAQRFLRACEYAAKHNEKRD